MYDRTLESRALRLCESSKRLSLSPLRLAIRRREFELLKFLLETEETDELPEIATEALYFHDTLVLDVIAPFSQQVLVSSATKGNLDFVVKLIKHGVQIDTPNDNGTTALVAAISNGHFFISKLLLWAGADPNVPALVPVYHHGRHFIYVFPVHVAASAGNLEVLKYLIDCGADLALHTGHGLNVFDCALKSKRHDVYGYLLDYLGRKNRIG
ncbi:hypothetical protein P9112_011343 [Eukaryota sp. TZLM1-RC]